MCIRVSLFLSSRLLGICGSVVGGGSRKNDFALHHFRGFTTAFIATFVLSIFFVFS